MQFWLPDYRKDMEALEMVQRLTKMVPVLGDFGYVGRLDRHGLFSLEQQRVQAVRTFSQGWQDQIPKGIALK